jgi:DNA-binding response OmpR family regulator
MIAKKDKVHGKNFVVFGGDVQLINSLERMLLFAGANVQAATTAYKGLSHVLNLRPDIVIFDDSASDIEPTKVIETLQADKLTKDIPVIVITASSTEDPYDAYFGNTLHNYIKKAEFDVMHAVLQIEGILRKVTKTSTEEQILDLSEDAIEKIGKKHLDLRVLVIEDDPLLRNLLSIRLQKSNINHQFWNSGLDAVAAVLEYKPSVIILDLMLPGKHGMDVLAELRDIPSISQTPVVIFSNKDDDEERARAKTLGVQDFLVKATTDLSDLIKLIMQRSS